MQERRSISKRLAVTCGSATPSFEAVSRAASTAALFQMSVQVLCLTQEDLHRWRRYVDGLPFDGLDLHIHDLNQATLAEWQKAINEIRSDMTVLAGFQAARRRYAISPHYANSLIDAVADGLVVMA